MLSRQTIITNSVDDVVQNLAELLLQIAEVERRVEVSRELLSENSKYNLANAYNVLSNNRTSNITQSDINSLLVNSGCELTRKELNMLWDFMDKNQDGVLDWREFFQQFSTHDTVYRDIYGGHTGWDFSAKLQRSMVRVLEEEIHGILELERYKAKLYSTPNYKLEHLFDSIDVARKGYITQSDIESFLNEVVPDRVHFAEKKSGYNSSKSARILNRLDLNRDNTISYQEFSRGIRPQDLSSIDQTSSLDPLNFEGFVNTTTCYQTLPQASTYLANQIQSDADSRAVGRRVVRLEGSPSYTNVTHNLVSTALERSRSPAHYLNSTRELVNSNRVIQTPTSPSYRQIVTGSRSPSYREIVSGSRSPSYRVIANETIPTTTSYLPDVTTYDRRYQPTTATVDYSTHDTQVYRSRSPTV